MKIVHICGNYIGNKLFSQWFNLMADMNLEQYVYIPVPIKMRTKLTDFVTNNLEIKYSCVKTNLDRIMYFRKINKYYNEVIRNVNFTSVDVVHAHMLFSDGGVAYRLNKQFGIPYIVAVRDTDINVFMKYFPHVRPFIKKVLENASEIILISPAYKDKLYRYLSQSDINRLEHKIRIIPNGIPDYWIKDCYYRKDFNPSELKLIQVGKLIKRKNNITTIKVVSRLREKGFKASLVIVGSGKLQKELESKIKKLKLDECVKLIGEVDSQRLKQLYRECDIFVMPSKSETFGNVYIEAMSQGLPIIYTEGQGIDGYFEDGLVGKCVNPFDVNQIADRIIEIAEKYDDISTNCSNNNSKFNWKDISREYLTIYNSVKYDNLDREIN